MEIDPNLVFSFLCIGRIASYYYYYYYISSLEQEQDTKLTPTPMNVINGTEQIV